MIGANIAWMWATWYWTERETWLWVTPIALSINFLLLTYDQVLRLLPLDTHELNGNDGWGLLKTVHRLAERHQMPAPRVFLIHRESAQIFAYARFRRQQRLFVSVGALQLLTPGELETVITHQLMGIRHSLSIANYWVGVILDLIYRVGRGIEQGFALIFGWAPRLSAWLMRPTLLLMRGLLLSRRDIEWIDHQTAEALKASPTDHKTEDLARAMWKLSAYAQTKPWPDSWAFAHMCVVSPLENREAADWLRVQPHVKSRIKALTGRYPL